MHKKFIIAWLIGVFAFITPGGELAIAASVNYNVTKTFCGLTTGTSGQGWYKATGATFGSCVDCSTLNAGGNSYFPLKVTSGDYLGGYKCVACGGSAPNPVNVNGTWKCCKANQKSC